MLEREGRFLAPEDLHLFTAGLRRAGRGLYSQTVQAVNEEYGRRRIPFRKRRLRWRVPDRRRANYSLGWVPFKWVSTSASGIATTSPSTGYARGASRRTPAAGGTSTW